jgi:predicted oxidoreductase
MIADRGQAMEDNSTDVIVIGAGLAGLVATAELAAKGKRVMLLDQEPPQSMGGQAFWSFGGLFLVDSPEQRRMRIKDSRELALQDWIASASFDRAEDYWPRQWAEAYVDFAAGEKRAWLHGLGVRFFPVVGWAERGGGLATGHGNSVPRFHITWGTGPGIVAPFVRRVREAVVQGLVSLRFRHRVNRLLTSGGSVTGVAGDILAPSTAERGAPSSRDVLEPFELKAQVVIVAAGGIGGNHELVRQNWPARLGVPPQTMLSGVPEHVDGRMLGIAEDAGASLINRDRMWHYTEGVTNYTPIWPAHGIRIIPGPSSLWVDATGRRLPAPLFPGFDTLATLKAITETGHGYSWFILNQRIIAKEFALSGSEQNPDLTGKSIAGTLSRVLRKGATPVARFQRQGVDFLTAGTLDELTARMKALADDGLLDGERLALEVAARDREIANVFTKDAQIAALRNARHYLGDRLVRAVQPHALLNPKAGPLIAVRLWILTRKTLGGLHTDLSARVLSEEGEPLGNVYAAGEIAGFGGGGMHGYRSLEGTFLGGCLFSGRIAGRAAAAALG